jgi:hypothetical protein
VNDPDVINYKVAGDGHQSENMVHFCVCPKPGPEFPLAYVVIFLMFSDMK